MGKGVVFYVRIFNGKRNLLNKYSKIITIYIMCIQLDTGNATIGEIEEAADIVRSEGNENIIIHNCPSG